jgi:endonuclease/exonuclease/phosphatase family metal-dependent hydrolase
MLLRALLFFATLSLPAETLRVASYNVRYPATEDGPNLWEKRKPIFLASLKHLDPDIIGTQELFALQGNFIVENLKDYDWFGLSRRGNSEDEHMGIFYKKSKFFLLDQGNFWLSEAPDSPGSVSWNMSLPRMATWGLFESKASRRRFYFVNTHFPHRREDAAARLECAKVLAARLGRLREDAPLILTGDFNTGADSDVHDYLSKLFAGEFRDAWDAAPARKGPPGTFHGFSGKPGPARIDWIFSRHFRALSAEASTWEQNGFYPSDHFPILALLELP